MNPEILRHLRAIIRCMVISSLWALPVARAQVAPPARDSGKPTGDEVIELSPFTVQATSDTSYGALNSNSITSFNTELEKLPISADVITTTFMEDTNSTTLENMLRQYSAGAGTGSASGDVAGIPVNQPLDRGGGDSVSAGVQLRGLGAAVVKQDGFMLPSPAGTGLNSNFGVERVEVINGPQALLYGNGGGGGVVNIISKPARFDRKQSGAVKLQLDQYGHELGQFDYSASHGNAALTLSLLYQDLGDNRDFLGGPLRGVYGQLAFKLPLNTIVRLTGKRTDFTRLVQQNLALNAGSTAIDARHGQNIRYLLATNQMAASAAGPSGAGLIGNGKINWDNVDSYGAKEEITTARLGAISFETNWRPWLSTQLAIGYQDKESKIGFGSSITFYSPTATSNPLPGQWTVGTTGSDASSAWANQPSDSKSYRLSALMTHGLFGGRARSQTIVGAEYTKANYANENYAYYEADGSFNVIRNAAGQRILLDDPNPFRSVTNGPDKYPFYPVATPHITYAGKNYATESINQTDPALVTAQNPQGVTGTALFIHSRAISKGAFAVNYSQWNDGKLATLAGVRWVSADNRQLPSTAIPAIRASDDNLSYSLGANYAVTPWLRPYATVSDTYNLPGILLTIPADPYGRPAPISHSLGEEIGVKLGGSGKISGSLALYAVQSKDEPLSIPSQLRDSINPAGLNGRHLGATGTVIKVDRESHGLQAAITASPTRSWRMRLSGAFVEGKINNTTSYAPLYNDQFYTNAQGEVTYANGTVVYVRPTALSTPGTSASAGYIPLTVAKLSTPGDPYYANPNPITGLIGSSTGRNVLNYTASPNGPIKTGVTGLPISKLQITGITPPDTIVTSRAGDHTTGYPEMSFSLTNVYTLDEGFLRGLKLGGTVNCAWRLADYYYYPTGYSPTATRTLLYRPTKAYFNAIVGYEHRFKKITWATQVNIDNMFNTYSVFIRPNNISGYGGINQAIWTNQPRSYTWTNTFRF